MKKFKDLRYVVMGKGCPRSVGLTMKSSAIKYRDYFKEKNKNCKPKIYQIENAKLRERFIERGKHTKSWRKKHK